MPDPKDKATPDPESPEIKDSTEETTTASDTKDVATSDEDTDQQTSDDESTKKEKEEEQRKFNASFGKGSKKTRKDMYKDLGVTTDAEYKKVTEQLAKAREKAAKDNGNEGLVKELEATKAERDELKTYLDEQWEEAAEKLQKVDKAFFETIDDEAIPLRKRIQLANKALATSADPKRKGSKTGIAPADKETPYLNDQAFIKRYTEKYGEKPTKGPVADRAFKTYLKAKEKKISY